MKDQCVLRGTLLTGTSSQPDLGAISGPQSLCRTTTSRRRRHSYGGRCETYRANANKSLNCGLIFTVGLLGFPCEYKYAANRDEQLVASLLT